MIYEFYFIKLQFISLKKKKKKKKHVESYTVVYESI